MIQLYHEKTRRFLSVLLVIVLVFTAASCSKKGIAPEPSGSISSSEPTKAGETAGPTKSEPAETPTPTIVGEKANDTGTLYAVDKTISLDGFMIEGCYYYNNDTLVVVYRGTDYELRVGFYNIYTGTVEKVKDYKTQLYVDQCIVCDNGNIFLYSTWGNTFLLLDPNLEEILYSDAIQETFTSMVSSYDGVNFYYLGKDGYSLNRYNISTKESSLVTTLPKDKLSLMLIQMTQDNQHITIQYSDSTGSLAYMIYNITTSEIVDLGDYTNNLMTSGNMYSLMDYNNTSKGYIMTFDVSKPRVLTKKYFLDAEEGTCFRLNGATNTIVSVSHLPTSDDAIDGGLIRLYNADSMEVEKETQIKREVLLALSGRGSTEDDPAYYYINGSSMQVSQDKKTALVVHSMENYAGVLLWDLSTDKDKTTNEKHGLAFINTFEVTAEDNDEYAEKIYKEYNVNLYIRDKAVRYFPDFAVNALYDENTTNEALKIVEEVLSRYPKGFFKELKYGSIKKFEIYLCGTLVQGNDYGISNPGGFALQYNGSQMIVLDATYTSSIKNNLSHEIMHAIDSRMDYLASEGKFSYTIFENWNKLNPKNYDYRYGYVDENGVEYDAVNNAAYTPNDEKSRDNVDNIYFIDYYANTFPNEDRARIFENLMAADTELSYEFNSKHLKKKAIYLSRMIRKAFKSIPDDELMYWERFLTEDVFKPLK